MAENHLGQLLYVAQGRPATNDAAGFEAMNWILVRKPQGFPEPGTEHAEGSAANVSANKMEYYKGIASHRETTFGMIFPSGAADPGQDLLKTMANDDQGFGCTKVVDPTGPKDSEGYGTPVAGDDTTYMQGKFRSYSRNEGSDTSHKGATVTFRQDETEVEAPHPAA